MPSFAPNFNFSTSSSSYNHVIVNVIIIKSITFIVSTLAPQINYIYILFMLGCIGAKLGGLYEDDAKMDANGVHFSIPNKLHLNSTCARLSRCKTRHII